jgi:hypothetical protein
MAKHERVLALFPSVYAALERTTLLYDVARRLAEPLEHGDTQLFRIQRAHRLRMAEDADDVIRLAALLDLSARHFDDLLEPDDGDDVQGADARSRVIERHTGRLAAMRARIERIARLHLDGLGTPWAVIEGAAIFLGADVVRAAPDAPFVRHEDESGFSHWAAVEFSRAPDAPPSRIYLHENPLRQRRAEPTARYPMSSWRLKNDNVESTRVRVVIEGIGQRAVLPRVFCPSTGEGITFYGIVPDGKRLVIDPVAGATLDGRAADEWVSYDVGARFDVGARLDPSPGSIGRFAVERDGPRQPFDGDVTRLFPSPWRRRKPTPRIEIGESEWMFSVALGVYDGSVADFAVFATPAEPPGKFDEEPGYGASVFDYPASAEVGIAWSERTPCAFKLLVPSRVAGPGASGSGEPRWKRTDLARVSAMLARFQPAGVRAFVDVAKDSWILGESVLRSATAAAGDDMGVEHQATRVRIPGADRFIPLDPTTLNA